MTQRAETLSTRAGSGPKSVSNIEILARALCYGLQLPKHISADSPISTLERGFIQGSVLLFDRRRPINTAILDEMANGTNAIPLIELEGELWIDWQGKRIPCPILTQPECLSEIVSSIGPIGDYFKFHSPETLFATPVRQCVFGEIGKPCQFCTFEMIKPRPLSPDDFGEMFEKIRKERNIASVALGAGTPNLNDHGIRYFCNLVQKIKESWSGGISVELVPPHKIEDIDLLIEAGVGSIIMSIEIWDDTQRHVMCPGKSYMSKGDYINSWNRAIQKLGRGKVSSVLLVGLEPTRSTKDGIDQLCEIGVVPTLIPYRAYDHTAAPLPIQVNHEEYIDVSKYNIYAMQQNNVSPRQQVGCTQCGGCSLDIERATGLLRTQNS